MPARKGYRLGRHRGNFCVVWTDAGGTRRRRSLGTDDPEAAKSRYGAFIAAFKAPSPEGPLTCGAIYKAYQDDRRRHGVSGERLAAAWKPLSSRFSALRPAEIAEADCRAYIEARRAEGVGDGTIWTELTSLRAALGFAVRQHWLDAKPYIHVPRKPAGRTRHLTREEARCLTAAAGAPHIALFIRIALATAGRAAAILDLTWDRVDLKRGRIRLDMPSEAEPCQDPGSVPIHDTLRTALETARRRALTAHVIEFGGRRVASVKKGVAAAARRAGIKASPQVLRHTAAVWMAGAGVPMADIAHYLGHDDSRITTRIYARYAPDHLRDAAEALEL